MSLSPLSECAGGGLHRLVRAWLPSILVVLAAACYFGLFFRCGFNLPDEGSVALLAKRLLAGERPFKDVELGYNVLWFYPIAGLFKVFGTNLLVMRAWFFLLQTITALLACSLLARISGKPWRGFLVALLLIVIPGPQHKAYIPLMVVANGWCLAWMIRAGADFGKMRGPLMVGGAVLGVSLLIRVDIGIFCTALWLGMIVLRVIGGDGGGRRVLAAAGGIALLAVMVALVHAPVYLDAQRRNFVGEWIGRYPGHINLMRNELTKLVVQKAPPVVAPDAPFLLPAVKPEPDRNTLRRPPLKDAWKRKHFIDRARAFLTYAPFLSIPLLLAVALGGLVRDWRTQRALAFTEFLTLFSLAGVALTDFPQFFAFRPDVPHLSEFMPGFMVAAVCGVSLSFRHWKASDCFGRISTGLAAAACAVHVAVYFAYVLPKSSAGTIALRAGRTECFRAANGVDVLLTPEECVGLTALRDLIWTSSSPEEYVVCYPYAPGVNFMTDRRTYEHSLYVDNATRSAHFDQETIAAIQEKKPAVIVIDDWKINKTEDSAFSRWAAPTKDYISERYHYRGTFLNQQVFTRNMPPEQAALRPTP